LRHIFILFLVFLASCQEKSDTIVIGNFGALTGAEASYGISSRDAIILAIEEWNKNGGLLGKQIELKVYDNQGKTDEARLSVERLIEIDNVAAILGESASTRSIAAAAVAQKNSVPLISPSSTNPQLTKIGDYIFRVCFIDPFQGEVMAKFAFETLKLKKAAILTDTQSDYSTGLAEFFIKKFESLGGEIVANEKYISGDVDFKNQLKIVKNAKPEFIFVPGYYTEVGLIARQVRVEGISVPLMGGDGWDSEKLSEIGGESINGSYFSNHYTQEDPGQAVQDFISMYEARFGSKPDSQAASSYDAARILFEAIKKANSLDRKAIRDAIARTTNFKGVTGNITINEERDVFKPAVVLQVYGKNFKYVGTIDPKNSF
jgi:branched-chain amino acid transport system substrate-binding protein